MSTKPIVPRNGKAMTNWMNQDGAPIADNWHLQALSSAGGMASDAQSPGPQSITPVLGDVALVGYSADAGGKGFALLLLADLTGETINITDNGWTAAGAFRTGEGTLSITIPAGLPVGTVIRVSGLDGTPVVTTSTGVTLTTANYVETGDVNPSTTGDQYLVYTGTAASPTFLFSIDFADGNTTYAGDSTNTNTSAVPTGLTLGTNALAFGPDNGAYTGPVTGTRAEILTNIANSGNWTTNDTVVQTYPGTFTVNGSALTLSINDVTKAEGDSGTVTFTFTVSLTAPAPVGGVTFDIATADGTATTAGNDYVARALTSQTIPEGSTSYTFDVTVNGDDVPEGPSETFFVNITNVTGAAAGDVQGLGTITNDDAFGALAINDVILAEGNSGTTNFIFTVTRSGGDDGTVSADYTVNLPGGTGNADGSDVSGALSGTITFLDGETSKTITVTVNGDLVEEPSENFTVTLSNAQGGVTISDATGLGTITNDDSPPVGSINDIAVAEGADGVSYLVFTVTLDHSSTSTVTFDYATANGTAIAGSDYVARTGQISFASGETSHTISIPIVGDTVSEGNETLTVALTNPVNGSVGDGSGVGTITNDDGSGSAYYSLAGGSFTQDWTDTNQITANDNWSGVPFIIGYLGDIDAGSSTGVDPRTLTGPNLGQVDVIANLANTSSISGGVGEFQLTNPTIGLQGSGTADAPSIVLYMDATGRSDIRVQANLRDIDTGTDDAAQPIAVQYRTSPTGAWINAPGGYFADVTQLDTPQSDPKVTVVDITLPPDANGAATLEIRFLTTNAPSNDEWVGIDDIVVSSQQAGPTLSIANTAVFEGDAGTTPISFTVTRAGSTVGDVTADWTVNFPGGANGADSSDFAAGQLFTGQVHFADGQTTATITLNVAGDTGPELDDNFTVTLSNVVGGTIGDGVGTGTIVNDDGQPPLVTINDVTVTEGDSGTSLMTFTVTRTGGIL